MIGALVEYECFACGSVVVRPAAEADGAPCPFCGGADRGAALPFGEGEWRRCEAPEVLRQALAELGRPPSARKARLARCEVCRRLYGAIDAALRDALDTAAAHADGRAGEGALAAAEERLLCGSVEPGEGRPVWWRDALSCVEAGGEESDWPGDSGRSGPTPVGASPQAVAAECYRDIFGNPFRPVAFSASWRTDAGVALAAQMYESRDFGAMPILADALQEAGCDVEEVLDHCRDPEGTHVRGCWVVDLLLGKE